VLIATSPMSATESDSNGAARVAMLYGRSSADSALIWRGPKRVPERLEVPMSSGTPTKQASRPTALSAAGSRIIVAGPAKRGMVFPPSGW
jgi:hypothetical protein